MATWARYDHRGWKGIGQARAAVNLADPASRTTWESRLRVFYLQVAQMPPPEVNRPIFDLEGNLLGIPDLLDEEAGLVTEFDGQGHRGRSQHREDNVREDTFEAAGLTVVRADSLDLRLHRQQLRDQLRGGHRRGMLRNRSRDGCTTVEPAWWIEVMGSNDVLTDAEKAELFGDP